MGGKTKQSQRTKNNVRPSSSGRSAELLSNTIKVDSSLLTVASGKVLPVIFPTLNLTNIDQSLSPEYSVCFKKLNKKDPVTKTKALQELTELVKTGNVEDAVAALASWSHYYQTLITDSDRRVREVAQACHGALLGACGRRAAPQLRRLLPAWLLARHDDHAPAAALAHAQLENTFPDNKLGEALSFCKSEIMTLLIDNLTGNAEAMLSKKVENPQERETQTQRILASSLRALELFASRLPEALADWLWAALAPLLQAAAFWKLAAHEADNIRTSWYGACGQLCARVGPRLGGAAGARVGRALLARPERGAAAAQRWAALLLLMHHVEDWHTWLDKKDLLVKRLLDVIENGGWGEAHLLSNMLLPLLSKLPSDLVNKEFYTTFFNAIFTGLNNKNVLSSKSERQTWINILEECLRYLSIQDHEYVVEVVTYAHRTWLASVFALGDAQAQSNLIKHSATNMASLVKYWLKQTKEGSSEKYDQLIRNYWLNIGSTISKQIDGLSVEKDDITRLIESHILLLRTLKTAFLQEGKKRLRIQFADEKPVEADVAPPPSLIEKCDVTLVDRFEHNLNDVVETTCCDYFDFANSKQVSQAVFPTLITLINEFESKSLLLALARHFQQDTVYEFYDQVLRAWLAGDTMRCKALADVVFILLKYLTVEEQDRMFNSFQQFPPFVVEWCISLSLSGAQSASPAGRRWLRGEAAEAAALTLARRGDAGGLLAQLLGPGGDGDVLLSERAVRRVVQELAAAGAGAGAAAAALVATPQRALAEPLLMALFARMLQGREDDDASDARGWWRGALAALTREHSERLRRSAAAELHAHVFQHVKDLDMDRIEHAASLCPDLLIPDRTGSPGDPGEVVSLTELLFSIETKKPAVPMEVFALRCDCIEGNINCPFENDNEFIARIVSEADRDYEELTKTDLLYFLHNGLFCVFVLRAVLTRNKCSDDDMESWCDALLREEHFKEELNRTLYDFVVLKVLYERYAFWPDYDIIKRSKERMESVIEDILAVITPETKGPVLSHLTETAVTKGYYWAYARKCFEVKMKEITQRVRDSQNETPELSLEDSSGSPLVTSQEDGRVGEENGKEENVESDSRNKTPESEDCEPQSAADVFDASSLEEIVTGSGYFHSLQADGAGGRGAYGARCAVMLRSVWRAHAHERAVAARLAALAAALAPAACVLTAYYEHNHIMLYETDLTLAPWAQIVSNAAVAQFLSEAVRLRGWELSAQQWDFTTISLCSLVASLYLSAHSWGCCKVAIIARATMELFGTVREFISQVPAEAEKRQPAEHVLALTSEWKDIFAPDLNKHLFQLLMIALKPDAAPMTASRVSVLGALLGAAPRLQWALAPGALRADALAPRRLAAAAVAALRGVTPAPRKLLAFAALEAVSEPLVLEDAEKLREWCAREDESPRPEFSLSYFDDAMIHLQDLVDAALSNVNVLEGTCEMLPGSDSHSVALGHLLLAAALLRHCERARGDLAQFYIELLREHAYAAGLMASCARLLPAAVLRAALEDAPVPPRWLRAFRDEPALDVYQPCDAEAVGALACGVLAAALGGAAAGEARGWAGALGARAGGALRRLVRAAVAPALRRRLLRQLRERAHELRDAQVAIQWSRAEVRCELRLEERALELTLRLADDHPLTPPAAVAPPNSPAPDTHWIVLYLAYQNGTLLNALKMWIGAVSARVQSSPQCYICYCRMHPASGRLPSVPCHQCRNKFHSPCLRKWFSTSNKSNCPLCRTKF